MSVYIYVTAEQKGPNGWQLFAPMQKDPEWNDEFVPPWIIDGGWPALARTVINKITNLGLPPESSSELRSFYELLKKEEGNVSCGWGMFSKMKHIVVENPLSSPVKFRSLFSRIQDRSSLRLFCWWSY